VVDDLDTAMNNAALLVIDVQKGMDDPSRSARNNPDAEQHIARLLDAWRESGKFLAHIQHDSLNPNSVFVNGKPGFPIKDLVAPLSGEPWIVKNHHSAFVGTDLEEQLRDAGIETVIVTGLVANHCVESTARMANNLGFTVFLPRDATASWDDVSYDGSHFDAETIYQITLMNLHTEFATITTVDEVIQAIAQPAATAV
jgi:nicotinamidase-related amidase